MAPTLNGPCTSSSTTARRPSVRRRHSRCSRFMPVPSSCFTAAAPGGAGSRRGRPSRTAGHPSASSQRWSESEPRCLCTTSTARPPGARRSSQTRSRSCSARLADADRRVRPDRGRRRRSGGTSSGEATRDVGEAQGLRRWRGTGRGPAGSRRRPTRAPPAAARPACRRWARSRTRGRRTCRGPGGSGASRRSSLVAGSTRRPRTRRGRCAAGACGRAGRGARSAAPTGTAGSASK